MEKGKRIYRAENLFYRIDSAAERNGFLNSIRQGFKLVVPVFIIGAFALLLLNIPIPGYRDALAAFAGGAVFNLFLFIYQATFGVASLYIVYAVAYKNAIRISKKQHAIQNHMAATTALGCYFVLIGRDFDALGQYLTVNNVFIALLTAMSVPCLFFFLQTLFHRLFKRQYLGGDPDFTAAVASIFPMAAAGLLFASITILVNVAGFDNLQQMFVTGISYPFQRLGRSLGGGLLLVFLQTVLWFFGVHGSNAFEDVVKANFEGGAGVSKEFLDTFVLMGGCGAAVCLLLALFLFSRSKRNRVVTRASAVPMLFGINEIMVFGLPVVLNPIFFIPFLLTPVVLTLTSFAALSFGWIPTVAAESSASLLFWTSPVFVNSWLYADGPAGLFLQLFNILLGTAIYAPFVVLHDRLQKRKFAAMTDEMTAKVRRGEKIFERVEFFTRTDHLYGAATQFAHLLKYDIDRGRIPLYYQPLVSASGEVVAAEALLRWGSAPGAYFYPPLVVSIAKEDGSFDELTRCIIHKALDDLAVLNENRVKKIGVSVNIQADQLTNEKLIDWIVREADGRGLAPDLFGLEVTEENALNEKHDMQGVFERLKAHHIGVALDNFSMGHTSIQYLKDHIFDYVKLDGSLIKSMEENARSREIVESVARLGKTLGFSTIAEFVETESQRDILKGLGCGVYQGWLYSPAIDLARFIAFADFTNGEEEPEIVIPGI